ncbi:hypothetical protein [Candidatus Lokiarchaeum ossiferum]|uniref:hypothetical protein n=1 Tax=Candidatus Lokiarchaeum ossiferum TaxID=2951803 RepID=UPI00352F0E5E
MEKKKYYQRMFFIGACWNCGVSLPLFVISLFTTALFPIFGLEDPNNMIFLHASLLFIATFGIGYYIVGCDITKNHGLVLIGIIGKSCYFLVTLIYLILGDINWLMFLTGLIDLIFIGLFAEFLLNHQKLQK